MWRISAAFGLRPVSLDGGGGGAAKDPIGRRLKRDIPNRVNVFFSYKTFQPYIA